MSVIPASLNRIVTAIAVVTSFSAVLLSVEPAVSQSLAVEEDKIAHLLERLADPDQEGWQQIEEQLRIEWSKSGSPAMDLLLQRGQKAMEAEDYDAAIEHLTALIDHAPEFAEGWNLRATAFFRTERYGLALKDVRMALALNPDHFAAMMGLGIILESLGEEAQSLTVLRRANALNPHRDTISDLIGDLEGRLEGVDA